MSSSTQRYWLLKAEPEKRIVKGKDVKFSVDDFERVQTSPWEGVRNYEARNLMKEMKEGDKALFYHSNCKIPGIAAFAQVSKEAYPDHTAWDASHPYYDPKSDSKNPKWFMVDLTFTSRASNFVPLALLRKIADLSLSEIPDEISYLNEDSIKAIKGMDLVTRGRLSVQRVGEDAWTAVGQLAEKGGWEDMDMKPTKKGKGKKADSGGALKSKPKKSEKADPSDAEEGPEPEKSTSKTSTIKRKREAVEQEDTSELRDGLRRSTRSKK